METLEQKLENIGEPKAEKKPCGCKEKNVETDSDIDLLKMVFLQNYEMLTYLRSIEEERQALKQAEYEAEIQRKGWNIGYNTAFGVMVFGCLFTALAISIFATPDNR